MDILFLHGALGCKKHWEPIVSLLSSQSNIHVLDFPSHGDSNVSLNKIQLCDLVDFVRDYILKHQLNNVTIVGYSLGGYVGLKLAEEQLPGLEKVITIATKLNWNKEIASQEIEQLSKLEHLIPKFEKEHGSNALTLIKNTSTILKSIGESPLIKSEFANVKVPICMLVGENDTMVTQSEIEKFVEGNSFMEKIVLPEQPHLLQKMNASVLSQSILDCLK
jgi:pimeloyl-ACP methyl ester carboxylesterase